MPQITRAHTARLAIRTFKIATDALLLRGYYRLSGKSGKSVELALRTLSPEIYGSMNDPRTVELNGLEYVMDRLPRGVEECSHFVLTAMEELEGTSFERIQPPKRRRISYRVNDTDMCFVVTRGTSEIYDIITHITFLYIEAKKIHAQMFDEEGNLTKVWQELEANVARADTLSGKALDQAIWSLSILLGRTYHETRETYAYFEKGRQEDNSNNGLFHIVYRLGMVVKAEVDDHAHAAMLISFTPSLVNVIVHQIAGKHWAAAVKAKLCELGLEKRPLHVISANMHSGLNLLYGYGALKSGKKSKADGDIYGTIKTLFDKSDKIKDYAGKHGYFEIQDHSGAQIDCQLIDTGQLAGVRLHPDLRVDDAVMKNDPPVILIIDYAFGTQAFEAMDELSQPIGGETPLNIHSISVMGKAGILVGKKGDIMLATAHVLEGVPHTYIVKNDLSAADFDDSTAVFVGPIITVLGTSLQNRDLLEKFKTTSWNAVGLEMEGGHYQRAIDAAIVREHIRRDVKLRYAYYASDNPLQSGQTLASGSLGEEGIRPTYQITKVLLEKILNP